MMWNKARQASEPMVRGWRKRDFDALQTEITRRDPYLTFVINAVEQSVRIDRETMSNRVNLRGELGHPRIKARGSIELCRGLLGSESTVGHIAVDSLRPTEEEPNGRPNIEFQIRLRTEADILNLCRTLQAGVQGMRQVAISMRIAEIDNPTTWSTQFAEKGYASHLHIAAIDLSTLVGPSNPEAPPRF